MGVLEKSKKNPMRFLKCIICHREIENKEVKSELFRKTSQAFPHKKNSLMPIVVKLSKYPTVSYNPPESNILAIEIQ